MQMKDRSTNEAHLEAEIEKRIREMESPAYEFPKRFGGFDYIVVVAAVAVCLLLLIIGAHI